MSGRTVVYGNALVGSRGLIKWPATERRWVMRLLASLTAAERAEYERRMETAPRHRNGRIYDGTRAMIAEQVKLDARRQG